MYKRILLLIFVFLAIVIKLLVTTQPITNIKQSEKNFSNVSLDEMLIKLGYSKIPMIKIKGALYFKGVFQNQDVYFLLDTGSVAASILSDGIEKLKLKLIQSDEKTMNMTGEIKYSQKVILSDISIGNIKVAEFYATVMEQPFKNDLPTIVIGNDFLTEYNAIIDISRQVIYLNSETSLKNQAVIKQLLNACHYRNIPLTTLIDGHFSLPIQIDNALPVYFLFDTGTSQTTISDSYINFLNIDPISEYKTQAASNGNIKFTEVNLKKITFNPLQTFFEKPINLCDVNAAAANISSMAVFLGVVGIIGLSDMEKLHTIINIPNHSVFVDVK